jgi:DNA helicase-2/ATP-dependent DNA helicase PcrA
MTSYTAAQAEAIACLDEPLQIIACAGSGKTQVISERIASILRRPGVEPRNVIAFTFTEKAAAELKERVLSMVGEITGLAEMYIGTMHGYALDLLQRLVPDKFKFSVLTDITAQLLVDRYSAKSGLTSCPTSAKSGTLRRYVNSKLYLQVVSVLREDTVDYAKVPAGVIESFEKYMALLKAHASFDYTQMINCGGVPLRRSAGGRRLRPGAAAHQGRHQVRRRRRVPGRQPAARATGARPRALRREPVRGRRR